MKRLISVEPVSHVAGPRAQTKTPHMTVLNTII